MRGGLTMNETPPAGVSGDMLAGLAVRALDALPDPTLVIDLEGHVLLRNLAHKRMLAQMGIVPARTVLAVDEVAARVTDPDRFRAFVAANEQEPEAEHEEVFTFRSTVRTFVIRTSPVRSADCSLVGRLWVLRDVTEERLRSVDALADARTPLTAIQGFCELLASAEYDEPTRQEYLRLVLGQCERLAGTLDELFATA